VQALYLEGDGVGGFVGPQRFTKAQQVGGQAVVSYRQVLHYRQPLSAVMPRAVEKHHRFAPGLACFVPKYAPQGEFPATNAEGNFSG